MDYYNQLTETHKAILLMAAGFILLGSQLDWECLDGLRSVLSFAIFVIAIGLIAYGFIKIDGPAKVMSFFKQQTK